MSDGARMHGQLDWASAEMSSGRLTLSILGDISADWVQRFTGHLQLDPSPDQWGQIEVTDEHVTVESVQPGAAENLHRALEHAVSQTNSAFTSAAMQEEQREHSRSVAAPLLLVNLALIAVTLQWTRWAVPVRPIIVTAFVSFAPGWAILELCGLARGWHGLALAIAVSLSLAMIVSGGLLYAGAWSPFASLAILAGVTAAASTVLVARSKM
jgi:hypothetical protein